MAKPTVTPLRSSSSGPSTEAVPGLLYCDKPLPHQLRLPPALKAMLC